MVTMFTLDGVNELTSSHIVQHSSRTIRTERNEAHYIQQQQTTKNVNTAESYTHNANNNENKSPPLDFLI